MTIDCIFIGLSMDVAHIIGGEACDAHFFEFEEPTSVQYSPHGDLAVCDQIRHRVLLFNPIWELIKYDTKLITKISMQRSIQI